MYVLFKQAAILFFKGMNRLHFNASISSHDLIILGAGG